MAKTKNAVGGPIDNPPPRSLADVAAEIPGYTLPRGEGGDEKKRQAKRLSLHQKRDRQQLAANIVTACLEALDRPHLFTSEQLLLLDQLYDGASGLESLV